MKKILLLFAVLFSLGMTAQNQKVKYVNLKWAYDFQDKTNEYRLNTALKQKMEELGYTVYFDNEMPQEVRLDPCVEYVGDLSRGKGSLSTELTFVLKDCKGNIVFNNSGVSRLKKHNKSYMDALQNIFKYSTIGRLKIN
ncbi:hypothetical protein EG240_07675 [Paenimyroides tangerinum]|uniref:DUF4136 domain-containing protein n=1 Tax=Paenimyroides tangerinum TaxID=2488728 RepID=A0A3P3WA76_9FLAO|nr:hypothetical protein [Paenimyroides tangerinum]RRJ90896.1 hypothetical protein EG240_07675 [Paenimyroides tangerinum]